MYSCPSVHHDLATATVEIPTEVGQRQLVIAPAYFTEESLVYPQRKVVQILIRCCRNENRLFFCCDAITSHGEGLITIYGVSTFSNINIDIDNRKTKLTFINVIRKKVLDLTFASPCITNHIKFWELSEDCLMLDHQLHIKFNLESPERYTVYLN